MPIVKLTVLEVRVRGIRVTVDGDPREFWLPKARIDPINPETGEWIDDRQDLEPGMTLHFEVPEWLCQRHRQLSDTAAFEEAKAKHKLWKKNARQ